jgi:hypothetical protein
MVGVNSDGDLLSPRKSDDPKRLVDELDDLVRRMIAVAPEQEKLISYYGWRLGQAFLGPTTPQERTKAGREAIQRGLMPDEMMIVEVAMDLIDDGIVEPNMLAPRLAGQILDVLEERWKANPAERPWWGKTTRTRRARVKTVRDKLQRHVWRLLKEEFPEDTDDELKAKMKE